LLANVLGLVIYFLNRLSDNVFKWNKRPFPKFIISLTGSMGVLWLLIYPLLNNITFLPFELQDNEATSQLLNAILFRFYMLAFLSLVLFLIIDMLFFYYKYYSYIELQQVKTEKDHLSLQLESLKSQLSPHYLFNSLNTISALTEEDSQLAEAYIRNQTRVNDYILSQNAHKLTTLENELKGLEPYQFMLHIRYGEAVVLEQNIPKKYHRYMLPPLTLQMLVENAIKHNLFSDEQPLTIKIIASKDKLKVINNIQEKEYKDESFKIGLKNIRKRIALFTEKGIKTHKNKQFIVTIPLLQAEEK
jgi:uncharacterized membrane-anchored protein YhcB (DUF1043 family)